MANELPSRSMPGGWRNLRDIGAGDFAAVSLVERDGVRGAMKVATLSSSSVERLRLECSSLKSLDHSNIPHVIEDGTESDEPYFVMQEAPGKTILEVVNSWSRIGRTFGYVEALEYTQDILDALIYMQTTQELVHRDIKDANVIIDLENHAAMLVDFGFCKREGTSEMRDKDSFWRAGAARFSPPSKIDDPTLAVASHDIFATGVLAYRMLTGLFPWSAPADRGKKDYLRYIDSHPLVAPHELNTLIPVEVSNLVSRMLQLNDDERIRGAEALAQTRVLLQVDCGSEISAPALVSIDTYPHVVRDPIRGDIRITQEEYEILNTREMQRLRWIRQLGLTNLVYPGADHSRLSHSIGTLERAEAVMRSIEVSSGTRLDMEFRRQVRMFALVHDVTHVTMGHTVEDQLSIFPRHDENAPRFDRLVSSERSELGHTLARTSFGRAVRARMNPGSANQDDAVNHIVSGAVGADVLDYIDRDAYCCGLDHRADSALFRQFRLYAKENPGNRKLVSSNIGKYGVKTDRDFAVESLLNERYAMFLKVYSHSAKIAADAVLGKMLLTARSGRSGLNEADYEWLGDESLLWKMSSSRKEDVRELAYRLRNRQLPRGVFRGRLIPDNDRLEGATYREVQEWMRTQDLNTPAGRAKLEREIAKRAGIEPLRIFVYSPAKAPGYKLANHWAQATSADRPAKESSNAAKDVARRHLALWEIWVFVADASERERMAVASAAEDQIPRTNIIEQYRKTMSIL